MIRFKTQLSLSSPNLSVYSTADSIPSLVSAVLSAAPFQVVRIRVGAHYVLPESASDDWRHATYLIGTDAAGADAAIGVCDLDGALSFGRVLFIR